MQLLTLRSVWFTKLRMFVAPHAASSIYTNLHLPVFQGVLLLGKHEDLFQAEMTVCKTLGPPELVPYDVVIRLSSFLDRRMQ